MENNKIITNTFNESPGPIFEIKTPPPWALFSPLFSLRHFLPSPPNSSSLLSSWLILLPIPTICRLVLCRQGYKPHNGHALCVCFCQIRYWRAEDWCFQHTERKIERALC
ncbi:hypothetical protein I3760_05G249600 [Carya illinoinensis]|nr:hypothetical protein I3760_05G249600 [Carya illinoinensis]